MTLSIEPGLRIAAERPIHSRSCVIYAWNDRYSIHVDTLTQKPTEDKHVTIEPLLTLSIDEGQLLFDALFDAGYRRKDEATKHGEVAALNDHIHSLKATAEFQGEVIMRIIPEQDEKE